MAFTTKVCSHNHAARLKLSFVLPLHPSLWNSLKSGHIGLLLNTFDKSLTNFRANSVNYACPNKGYFGEMVKAWYMDDSTEDQRLEHHRSPPEFVDLVALKKSMGVEYFQLDDIENLANNETLSVLKKQRGYTYEDQITCSKECLLNYEEKIKSFFAEHLHTDEEIRLVLEGSGYFDVRDPEDRWVRIQVTPGDLLIIPAGIYHRFTLDTNNFIRAKRFFIGEPVWTPYNRPADDMACRKSYVERLPRGF